MDDAEWVQLGRIVENMRTRGFFMAAWSPGKVTNGRECFTYPRWRVHFQRGAEDVAPVYEVEGYGEGESLLEAVRAARDAALELADFE